MAKDRKGQRHLTDLERKKIVAAYAEIGTYAGTARRFGVADNTVKRIVQSSDTVAEKVAQKRNENTKSVLDFMDSRTAQVTDLIDQFLKAMKDEEKIDATSLPQLATAMGIVIDKFTMKERLGLEQKAEDKRRLRELQAIFGDKHEPK